MTIETLAAIATFVLLFGIISRRIERSIVTPPMAFVALGILLGHSYYSVRQTFKSIS